MQLFTPEFPSPSAVRAHAPDPRTAETTSNQRGFSIPESDMWGGLEEPIPRVTPGVTPSTIRRANLIRDELIGRHSALYPSPPKGSKNTGAIDVAKIRAQHQASRDEAASLEGDNGKVTLSEAIASGQATLPAEEPAVAQPAASPPSEYERSREGQPQLPGFLIDEVILRT